MTNKEFAEKNAGKYFACDGGYKTRVVGYCKGNDHSIIVSVSPRGNNFSWSRGVLDEDDILVTPSRASRFWYFDESDLEEWK